MMEEPDHFSMVEVHVKQAGRNLEMVRLHEFVARRQWRALFRKEDREPLRRQGQNLASRSRLETA
jgi:hypothetical protein